MRTQGHSSAKANFCPHQKGVQGHSFLVKLCNYVCMCVCFLSEARPVNLLLSKQTRWSSAVAVVDPTVCPALHDLFNGGF